MKNKILLGLLLGIFLVSFVSADWWDNGYDYRKPVNITGGEDTLNNYPILINVTYDSDMQGDFDDLRFIEGACSGTQDTELAYEIDNKVDSSYAMVWVNIPTLNTGTNEICMYYGNSSVSSGENKEVVWQDYLMVYHFNDGGTTLYDSTSTSLNLTATSDPDYNSSGYIGGTYTFDGNDYFESVGANTPHYQGNVTIETFSMSTQESASSNDWIIQFESSGGTAVGGIFQYTTSKSIYFSHDTSDQAENSWDTGIDFNISNWDYIVGVWEYGSQTPYINKIKGTAQTDTGTWAYAPDGKLFVGTWKDNGALAWVGNIDELRVSNISRSSAWINRTYDIADFSLITLSDEEMLVTGNPPEFITIPENVTGEYPDVEVAVQFEANDSDNNFDSWAIDDTTNFEINQSGYLTNKTLLGRAIYDVTVTINDTDGNTADVIFRVTVTPVPSICTILHSSPYTADQQINITAFCTSTEQPVQLFRDGVDVTSENGLFITLSEGNYTYLANNTESQNYTNGSTTELIIVNPAVVSEEVETDPIYNPIVSAGAGLGLILTYLANSLPVLLLVIGIVGVIVIIGLGIARVFYGIFFQWKVR